MFSLDPKFTFLHLPVSFIEKGIGIRVAKPSEEKQRVSQANMEQLVLSIAPPVQKFEIVDALGENK